MEKTLRREWGRMMYGNNTNPTSIKPSEAPGSNVTIIDGQQPGSFSALRNRLYGIKNQYSLATTPGHHSRPLVGANDVESMPTGDVSSLFCMNREWKQSVVEVDFFQRPWLNWDFLVA